MTSMWVKSGCLSAVMMVSLLASHAAGASTIQTLNFDDLTPDTLGSVIANGYQGYDWNNFHAINGANYSAGSGYDTGTVSTPNVAFNGFGNDASLSRTTAFDFLGGSFTGAWNDGLSVTLTGLLDGLQKFTTTFTVNTAGPILEALNWSNIDTVTFHSEGGTDNPALSGSGEHFVMDDLKVSDVSAVPLPAALPMFGVALLGLGAVAVQRRRAAQAL